MKTKIIRYTAILSLAITACNKEELSIPANPTIQATTRISGTTRATKTTTDDAFNTLWAADDAIGIFAPEAYCGWSAYEGGSVFFQTDRAKNMNFKVGSGEGSSKASFVISTNRIVFNGEFGWNKSAPEGLHHFYAYYPFNEGAGAATPYTAIPFTLSNHQTQNGTGSKAHIGALDFMHSSLQLALPAGATDKEVITHELDFSFSHAFALLEFTILNPAGTTLEISKVILDGGNEGIAGDFTFNLPDETRTIGKKIDGSGTVIAGTIQKTITLNTKNPDNSGSLSIGAGASAKVYMVVNPANLVSATIKVETGDNRYQAFAGSVNLSAGKYYTKTLELNALQSNNFTLATTDFDNIVLNADGILQKTTLLRHDDYGEEMGSFYGYTIDDITFQTYIGGTWMPDTWFGFTFSNHADMTTAGMANQYSVYNTGGHSGSQFVVGYDALQAAMGPGYETTLTLSAAKVVDHLYITNSTYTVFSIKNGDSYAKIHSYADKDWYKVTVTGYNGKTKTGSIDCYLSDFRTPESKGIVTSWEKMDLSSLGKVTSLQFTTDGSDKRNGLYLNTPAYFCIDDIAVQQ